MGLRSPGRVGRPPGRRGAERVKAAAAAAGAGLAGRTRGPLLTGASGPETETQPRPWAGAWGVGEAAWRGRPGAGGRAGPAGRAGPERAAQGAGRCRPPGRRHAKMLEICLKLVGCKSKKGLSSSSSCYLEGKRRPAPSGSGRRWGHGSGLPGPHPPARALPPLPPWPSLPLPFLSLSLYLFLCLSCDRAWALRAEWEGAGLPSSRPNPGRAHAGTGMAMSPGPSRAALHEKV